MRVPTGFTGRVAAGAIAERYLKMAYGVEIVAFVSSVGKVQLPSAVSPPSQVPAEYDDAVEDAVLKKDMVVRARARGARTGDSRLPFQPWRLSLAMCAVDALAVPRVGRAHLPSPHLLMI